VVLRRALKLHALERENRELRQQTASAFEGMLGTSPRMQEVFASIRKVATVDAPVLVLGESGTGKELAAHAVHRLGARAAGPFVPINCGAIPGELLESELFGHEKGAFTGAIAQKKGKFELAEGGTLFLDEIGDLAPHLQAKLLRVLQERQFYAVGGEQPIDVDVRVIVATNKDLQQEVAQGTFREDLYYRIHVIPIHLPPLRERKEDIPLLVEHFLRKAGSQMKKTVKGLSPRALQRLMLRDWPGNVRELENAIEYAMAMTRDDVISEDLIVPAKSGAAEETLRPLKEAKEAFEKKYLMNLLKLTRGNVTNAAEMAGKYRADFYTLLKKYDLNPSDFKK
jgi:two-component system response regulator GlrR